MSIDRTQTVEWDGKALSGWVIVDGTSRKVTADRNTIHAHAPGFNDALTWEIDRHRTEIFEKLLPFFQRQTQLLQGPRGSMGHTTDRGRPQLGCRSH
jgi:hypothetical protein